MWDLSSRHLGVLVTSCSPRGQPSWGLALLGERTPWSAVLRACSGSSSPFCCSSTDHPLCLLTWGLLMTSSGHDELGG